MMGLSPKTGSWGWDYGALLKRALSPWLCTMYIWATSWNTIQYNTPIQYDKVQLTSSSCVLLSPVTVNVHYNEIYLQYVFYNLFIHILISYHLSYVLVTVLYTCKEIKAASTEYVYHKWKEKWMALKKYRISKVFYHGPDRRVGKVVARLSRKDMTLFTHTITGHSNLNYMKSIIIP